MTALFHRIAGQSKWGNLLFGWTPGAIASLVATSPAIISVVAGGLAGWVVGWPADRFLVWFFGVFNTTFAALTKGYTWIVGAACSRGASPFS